MATTEVLSGLELTKWKKSFIQAYHRDSGFEPYMGKSEMDIIQIVSDLQTDGYTIRVPLVLDLLSDGVENNQRLSGREERLDQYYFDVQWKYFRHAVETNKFERDKSAVGMLEVKKPLLRSWAAEKIKYQLVDTFHSINGTKYSAASEATKDAWLAANADRVLFGNALGNNSANDHSAALAQIDATDDKLTAASVRLMKRVARNAWPRIKPFKTGTQGREYYVCFTHPRCFRDLNNDTAILAANRDARAREGSAMDKNPLFQDGDIIYQGIIFREIPELEVSRNSSSINAETTLDNVGGSSIDVGANFLCGAQAISYVQKQIATPITKKEDDYGFVDGVGVEMAHGIAKTRWDNGDDEGGLSGVTKDFGMVTAYFAATPDT